MKPAHVLVAVIFGGLLPVGGQSLPPQKAPEILRTSTDTNLLRWHGHQGRSYFLQVSDPSKHLEKWLWMPVIIAGADAEISQEVQTTGNKGFYRICYTDQVPGAGETLETADFDQDGLSNINEIRPQNGLATHPLNPDTDADGLKDGWEVSHAFNPHDFSDAAGDKDGDGLTNLQEYQWGANPTNPDTDGDGALDGDEKDGNTNLKDPESAPQEGWIVLTGDYPKEERKALKRTVTIPKGQTRVVVVVLHSEEYPEYTEYNSEFDDLLEWKITPTGGTEIAGQAGVNDKHADWQLAESNGTAIKNFYPAHIEKVSSLTAPPEKDLIVTLELAATNISDDEKPSTAMVGLLPVEVKQVISDQIAGNEANKLPTAFYGKQPNNPMLMATRTGKDARLQIVVDVPDECAADIRVGVRVVDNRTVILGSAASLPGGAKTPLAFTAVDGKKLYEVVVGYDKNHDRILTDDEVLDTFEKTPRTDPGGGAYTGSDTTFAYLDKILIVTRNDFDAARQETEDYGDNTFFTTLRPEGAKLLKLFGAGGTLIAGANPNTWGQILDANVIPSPQGLSHPLGAVWNTSNQATTLKITYPTTSDLAIAVVDANGFNHLVSRIIFANKAALAATATGTFKTSAPIPFSDNKVAFGDTDNQEDVHLALGKCNAVGNLIVKYRSAPGGKIEVSKINCYGTISDLYDWAFGTKLTFPVLGNQIDLTKDAARTQAGYATLSPATAWPRAGRVFFTEVKFGSGWINWNNILY